MGIPFTTPVVGRRVNSDGTVDIKCRICERTICREMYRGFSTAFCAFCSGELERGKRPDEIIRKVVAMEEEQGRELYNDLGQGGFKVAGIGKRTKEIVETIRQKATGRRRGPLLSNKD
jgi:hypothetical protein